MKTANISEVESLEGMTTLEFKGEAKALLLQYEQARAKKRRGAKIEELFKEIISPYVESIGLELDQGSPHINGTTTASLKPVKVSGGKYSTELHFMHLPVGDKLCAFAELVPHGSTSIYCLTDALVYSYRGGSNPFVRRNYSHRNLAVAPLSGIVSVYTTAQALSEVLDPHMPELIELRDLAEKHNGEKCQKKYHSAMERYVAKLEEALGVKTA